MVVAIKGLISLSRSPGQLIVTAEPMGKEMTRLQQSFRLEKKCSTWMGSWPAGLVVSWAEDLPSEMEKLMEWWYGVAKFRVSCIFRSSCGSERLPRSLLRFPILRRLLRSPRWGCGPLTLQAFRLDLTHRRMIQFCQLSSCLPFPVERFQ